jgi:hypothetical protein
MPYMLGGGEGRDELSARASALAGLRATALNALDGGGGNDRLTATAQADSLEHDAIAMNLLASGERNDVLRATADAATVLADAIAANHLDGGPGMDALGGAAAALSLDGGAVALNQLDGGAGWDELTADGAEGEDAVLVDFDLGLTGIIDGQIMNVEGLELTDGAPNRLFLTLEDVLGATDDAHMLFVEGDGAAATGSVADTAVLVGEWTPGPTVDGFASFALASATVSIDVDMSTDVVVS